MQTFSRLFFLVSIMSLILTGSSCRFLPIGDDAIVNKITPLPEDDISDDTDNVTDTELDPIESGTEAEILPLSETPSPEVESAKPVESVKKMVEPENIIEPGPQKSVVQLETQIPVETIQKTERVKPADVLAPEPKVAPEPIAIVPLEIKTVEIERETEIVEITPIPTIAQPEIVKPEVYVEPVILREIETEIEIASLPETMEPMQEAVESITKIIEEEPVYLPLATGHLSGVLKVISRGKSANPADVFVSLSPTGETTIENRPAITHILEMKGKRFIPRYSSIIVGDTVKFKNFDPFLHNVFSRSASNKFDLGTYGRGTEPEHQFTKPGVVKVYCNIHPSMVCFINIAASEFVAMSNKKGEFSIKNVPIGNYRLTAWSIRGKFEDAVTITSDGNTSVDIVIDSSKYKKKKHLNKYGKRYKRKGLDESY